MVYMVGEVDPFIGIMGMWFGLILLIYIVPIIFRIIITIWTYKDAQRWGMDPTIWAIVVLFAGIVGFIVYIVIRSDYRDRMLYQYYPPYPPRGRPPYSPPHSPPPSGNRYNYKPPREPPSHGGYIKY